MFDLFGDAITSLPVSLVGLRYHAMQREMSDDLPVFVGQQNAAPDYS